MLQQMFFWYMILGSFACSFLFCFDIFFFGRIFQRYKQYLFDMISHLIYQYIELKVEIEMQFKKLLPISHEMKINRIELYGGEGMKKKDVTSKLRKMNIYDKGVFEYIYLLEYGKHIETMNDKKNIRLKIVYTYMGKEYIQYISYVPVLRYEGGEMILKFPWFKKESMEWYRKDIVEPYFWEIRGKYVLYSLFMVECKNVMFYIKKRGEEMKEMKWKERDYLEKIKTPYQDFGILMNTPIRMSWILEENGVDVDEVESWKMVYVNDYFDEELMELRKHEKESKNVEDCMVTERVMEIVKRKSVLFGRKLLE
jgi:hypothetical protein